MKDHLIKYKSIREKKQPQFLILGNRIPVDFFETRGTGESDIAIHAGSYHLALKSANIERYNIVTYSSILPGIARRVKRPRIPVHGSVMESIMSVCHSRKGERSTAGIIYGWLFNRITGEKYGGLVCEHAGKYDNVELRKRLGMSLEELYINGFADGYELRDIEFLSESFVPEKKYGTALVALCFTSYHYPVINGNRQIT